MELGFHRAHVAEERGVELNATAKQPTRKSAKGTFVQHCVYTVNHIHSSETANP